MKATNEPVRTPTVFVSALCGYVAMWATRQSPYHAPDGLTEVLVEFSQRCQKATIKDFCLPDCILATRENLRQLLNSELLTIPQVQQWNNRKNGNTSPYGFVSRYDRPHPDNDFIDLDALVRNISRSCVDEDIRNYQEFVGASHGRLGNMLRNIGFRFGFNTPTRTT